jgi:protease-4
LHYRPTRPTCWPKAIGDGLTMSFARKVWRLLVGVKDALVLLFMLLFFALIYAALAATPGVPGGARGALLLDLSGPIVEQPSEASASELLGGGVMRSYRRAELVAGLRAAAKDDRVKAVALDLDIFAGGAQPALADVGAALEQVKKAGKPVIAYATGYSDSGYLLAAHASEIWVNPMGGVFVTGPGGTNLYMKGLLDRLGVAANVYRVGDYKAAVEPYTRNDMSPEARQDRQALADSLWESWQANVRRARPKAQIAPFVADLPGRVDAAGGDMARAALAAGLVDRVGEKADFNRRVAEIAGVRHASVPGSFRSIKYDDWAADHEVGDTGGEIGIVTVAGEIVDGEAGPGTAGGETIVRALEEGLRKHDLKALVLRVDSPGGSALASERIRKALVDAKAKGLPVVVSMGGVAASGGYWVATAGDRIFAEPSTITGSIGVFAIVPSFEGSLAKLGLGADGVKTTPLSGEPDTLKGPGPEADRLLQAGVDGIYRRFVALVSNARKLPPARVNEIGGGRVWDGGTARQLGLVDAFGSLDDAIAEAARRAKLDPEEAEAVYLEADGGFGARLLRALGGEARHAQVSRDPFTRLADGPRAMLARAFADARRIVEGPAIQVRCLACPAAFDTPAPRAEEDIHWLVRLLSL